jgi:hypothetical protein
MWSFLTGIGSAAILAGVTLWVLEVGTITMPESTDSVSVRLDGIWQQQSPATMSIPLVTQGNVEE